MGIVSVVRAKVLNRASTGATMPVFESEVLSSEVINSSSVSKKSTTVATSDGFEYWNISPKEDDLWVKFGVDEGANPTASPGNDWLVFARTEFTRSCKNGEKVAVINA